MKNDPGRRCIPLMWDMSGKIVLLVGGGQAALQKTKALLPFDVPVLVVSMEFHPELEALARQQPLVQLKKKGFEPDDLNRPEIGLVYACTDNLELNETLVKLCRGLSIAVCDASKPERGDFLSAASLKCGPFVMSVSSGGQAIKRAVEIRNTLKPEFERLAQEATPHNPII